MANIKLTGADLRQLLLDYESRKRVLRYELDRINTLHKELKGQLKEVEAEEAAAAKAVQAAEVLANSAAAQPKKPGRRGRPAGSKTKGKSQGTPAKASAAKAKSTEPKRPPKQGRAGSGKDKKKAGYRLSEYDNHLFDALRNYNRLMLLSDLIAWVNQDRAAKGLSADEDTTKKMLIRSLQKLANRRNEVAKLPYEGRGFYYGLPEWLKKDGSLKRGYGHKPFKQD